MRTLRAIAPLAIAVAFVAVLSAAPGQVPDFRMAAQIDHFDITCPPELDPRALVVGRQAERAYQRISSSLQRDLSFRPLLVLFPTAADQTRAIDTRTIPGNREHVLMALDTPENSVEGQFTTSCRTSFCSMSCRRVFIAMFRFGSLKDSPNINAANGLRVTAPR